MTGGINATSGTIGSNSTSSNRWQIGSTSIYNGTSSPTVNSSTAVGTYIGTDGILNYASSTAYVLLKNGIITAQGANITGTIHATGGEFGDANGYHVSVTGSDVEFWNGASSTATNKIASFGTNGVTLGKTGAAHSVIDSNGQRFYASDGSTLLANIGYGEGVSQSGTTFVAPYYTFGKRKTNSTIGNYSVAAGINVTASGWGSFAEGAQTNATNNLSHAEGILTTASGNYSHAEGESSTASGRASHAENH